MKKSAFTNHLNGTIQEASWIEFLELFDRSVWSHIEKRQAQDHVSGVMCMDNPDFCSSEFGKRTAMIFGPGCTYQTAEEASKAVLGADSASRRQYAAYVYLKP